MGVVVCSIFRDSTEYVPRYFDQVDKLEAELGETVRLVIAEGDSTDDTLDMLRDGLLSLRPVSEYPDDVLLKVDHGGPKFGSIDHPQRWAQIALVCNAVMNEASAYRGPKIYVESDLIWEPATMIQLLEDLAVYPAVAPMSMKDGGFYDTFGMRGLDGTCFDRREPYHPDLMLFAPVVEISSAGSCIAMREEVASVARFGENDCVVGLGRSIRHDAKASLWIDKRVQVTHP